MSKIEDGLIRVELLALEFPVLLSSLTTVLWERGSSQAGNFRAGLYVTIHNHLKSEPFLFVFFMKPIHAPQLFTSKLNPADKIAKLNNQAWRIDNHWCQNMCIHSGICK